MDFDFKLLSAPQAYHLMTQTVVPRPIAWVLTENETGETTDRYNLAPFSYFNSVASNPPTLMLSIGVQPDGRSKDTLKNIQRNREMVIHIASAHNLEALNQSAATLPYGQSELSASSLTTSAMQDAGLPRIEQAKVAFYCSLDHLHEIGPSPQTLVFARVESAYIADELVHVDEQTGRTHVDVQMLNPLARLGGNEYAFLGEYLTRKRPA